MQDHEYAVTLASGAADLDAFEDVLDRLPEACLIGSVATGTAALVFTAVATSPAECGRVALTMLDAVGLAVPNGSSLTILEHETGAAA